MLVLNYILLEKCNYSVPPSVRTIKLTSTVCSTNMIQNTCVINIERNDQLGQVLKELILLLVFSNELQNFVECKLLHLIPDPGGGQLF